MDTENNNIIEEDPDLQEIPLEIHGDEVVAEGDSYDELAKDVPQSPSGRRIEVAMEPPKRGRGRPLGAKNKKKVPEPEAVSEEESEPDEPETPHLREVPKRRKARASPMTPVLDTVFDEGYGGAGPPKKPVRVKRQPAAVSLMEIIAQAASQHGERERDRRRSFYENYLPL